MLFSLGECWHPEPIVDRCISACPYSHPDELFHRFIRWGIKNNLLFRHLALKLDDLYYGRRPAIRPLPGWVDIRDK